jgi:class 3 adenylate cyclase
VTPSFVAFVSAKQAVAAAVAAQQALAAHKWPENRRLWVRMGLHTGEPQLIDANYVGLDVHHAARVMAAAHGGQVLLSQSTRDLLESRRTCAIWASTASRICRCRNGSTSC